MSASPKPRQRILFMAEAITLSHVARPSVLAATLDPARYEVVFACDRSHLDFLGKPDYRILPLKSLVAGKDLERVAKFQDELVSLDTLEYYVREDLLLFDAWRPDVIVGDMRLSLPISARLARIPVVTIQNCHWHPTLAAPIETPLEPSVALPFLPRSLSLLLQDLMVNTVFAMSASYHNLLSARYGLPPVGMNMRDVFCYGDYVAFPDIVEWSRLPAVPANAAFVGPLLWSPPVRQPDWWERVPTDRPLVYLSLGSSGQPRVLESIIRVLAERRLGVMVATAGRIKLGSLPENVFVADYLDGSAAAARSALTICNGGSMSAPQALAVGSPVLGIASNNDQIAFMRSIEGTGAGLSIMERDLDEDSLRAALAGLLDQPGPRQAARRLSECIARVDTRAAFNRLLERALSVPDARAAAASN